MTIEKQITRGADKAIAAIANISQGEPNLAIAQLLLAAAILAKTIDMSASEFRRGFELASAEAFNTPHMGGKQKPSCS